MLVSLMSSSAQLILLECDEDCWLRQGSLSFWKNLAGDCLERVYETVRWPHPSQVSLTLTGDTKIQRLNATYRGKNTPTNVLSFPLLEYAEPTLPLGSPFEYNLLGDVVLSFGAVQEESVDLGLLFRDHVVHLLVHGVLHLLGYDHESERDAGVMESLEVDILKKFGIGSPYTCKETSVVYE